MKSQGPRATPELVPPWQEAARRQTKAAAIAFMVAVGAGAGLRQEPSPDCMKDRWYALGRSCSISLFPSPPQTSPRTP